MPVRIGLGLGAALALAATGGGWGAGAALAGTVLAGVSAYVLGRRGAAAERVFAPDGAEARLDDLERMIGGWTFECGPDLRLTRISRHVEGFSSAPAKAIAGMTLSELLRPLRGDTRVLLAEIAAGRPTRGIWQLTRVDRREAAVELATWPVRNAAGSVAGVRGLVRDVTVEQAAVEAAGRTEARLWDALDSLPDGFLLFDANDKLIATNKTVGAIYPVLAKHAQPGRTYEEMMRLSWRDGGQSVGDVEGEEYIRLRLESHREPTEPLLRRLRDGRWVEIVDRRMRDGGVVTRIVDMTARRKAEAEIETARRRLAEAIDNMQDGFALFDPEGRLVLCNQYFREMLVGVEDVIVPGVTYETLLRTGVARGAYGKGRDSEEWVQERLAAHLAGAVENAERVTPAGRTIRAVDRRTPSGHIVCVRTDVSDFKAVQRQLERRVCELEQAHEAMARQQAELKRLAVEMTKARDRADSANRAKTEFLANMSHELRTPLNAILGFSELMRSECFGPLGAAKYREYCTDIYDSGIHLLNLINDLLDLAKVESGMALLREQAVPVEVLIDNSLRMVRERAVQAQLRLVERVRPGLPALYADDRRVVQILVNLLSNAVKFTPEGGSVVISADRDEAGGIVIAVADTGMGIPNEAIEHVMEPFVQVEGPLSRHHEGTGLGLPLAKQLALAHGATLTLASTEGAGTTATVRFPPERSIVDAVPARAIAG